MVFQGLIVNVKFTVKLRKSEYFKKFHLQINHIHIKTSPRSLGVVHCFPRVEKQQVGGSVCDVCCTPLLLLKL